CVVLGIRGNITVPCDAFLAPLCGLSPYRSTAPRRAPATLDPAGRRSGPRALRVGTARRGEGVAPGLMPPSTIRALMLTLARRIVCLWRRLRFELWVLELRLRLRAAGGRLRVDAPHGAVLEERPAVKAYPRGKGGGAFELRIGRNV